MPRQKFCFQGLHLIFMCRSMILVKKAICLPDAPTSWMIVGRKMANPPRAFKPVKKIKLCAASSLLTLNFWETSRDSAAYLWTNFTILSYPLCVNTCENGRAWKMRSSIGHGKMPGPTTGKSCNPTHAVNSPDEGRSASGTVSRSTFIKLLIRVLNITSAHTVLKSADPCLPMFLSQVANAAVMCLWNSGIHLDAPIFITSKQKLFKAACRSSDGSKYAHIRKPPVYFTLGMNVPANVSVLSTCTCREKTIQTPESFKELHRRVSMPHGSWTMHAQPPWTSTKKTTCDDQARGNCKRSKQSL